MTQRTPEPSEYRQLAERIGGELVVRGDAVDSSSSGVGVRRCYRSHNFVHQRIAPECHIFSVGMLYAASFECQARYSQTSLGQDRLLM